MMNTETRKNDEINSTISCEESIHNKLSLAVLNHKIDDMKEEFNSMKEKVEIHSFLMNKTIVNIIYHIYLYTNFS